MDANKYYIHVSINHATLPSEWILTCAYGPPFDIDKSDFWSDHEYMVNNLNKHWLMIRDLSEILNSNEKFGGRNICSSSQNSLEVFMNNTGYIDLGCSENKFTWKNNRHGSSHIKQRLDRALANELGRIMFPNA